MLSTFPLAAVAVDTTEEADQEMAASQKLLLEIQINGHSIGKIGEFTLRNGILMARPEELRDLGLRVPATLPVQPGGLIALSELRGVTFTVDRAKMVLLLTASDAALLPTLLLPEGRESATARRVIESGTGLTLNYDTAGTFAGSQAGGTCALDFRIFSPQGIVSSDWLAYGGASLSASGTNTAIRLDSAYTYADVNTLRRYSLGDFITSGLAWTRPIHIGGAQIRSDFSMRPDLVTFPLPMLSGSAAVPSTVSVLANGNQTILSPVEAGPFEIPQLPVISGAGTISMTVTNALGQQVTVSQPFYASSALLAPGLQTYAAQLGKARLEWGLLSNDYSKMAGAAIYRRGLTRKFTIESSVEGTPGAFMAGLGGVVQIGHLGVVNFSVAPSAGNGQLAAQYSAGAQRISRLFSVGASAIVAGRNYRDIAVMNGAGIPRKQLSAFASLSHKRLGTVGAAYAGLDQDASPTPVSVGSAAPERSHVLSANYSRQFHRISFYATEFKSFAGVGSSGSSGLQAGMVIPFGRRSSVNISASSDDEVQVQLQQSASQIGQWGYQGYLSAGSTNHEFGEVQYKSHLGLYTAGLDQSGGQTTVRLETQGAFSYVDHGLFASNEIYDSFAIVDTSPVPHVHVEQENRDVGKTNSSGRLLVPDLRSFDLNHIAIDPTDIPPEVTVSWAKHELRPQDRSGVVVKFPIKFSHAALLRLVNKAGEPLPVGSTATLRSTGAVYPVGYDGDAYIEDLKTHNELVVVRPDGNSCTVAFDYKPLPGDIPSIGPLRCQEKLP
ncbi:MAG: fimbria/pilus outer membrane usher protein [Terracidiphilus sp.]